MDILFIGISVAFLVLALLYTSACERL